MKPRDRRLRNDYRALNRLAQRCLPVSQLDSRPRFEFDHNGNSEVGEYPDRYRVTLRVKGMEKYPPETIRREHSFTIYLPIRYPVEPPKIQWHTPIFHPNIRVFDENSRQYQELRDKFGSDELLNQEINRDPRWAEWMEQLEGHICLDVLDKNWTPFVGLDELIIQFANVVRYQTYTATHGYNQAAASWVKRQESIPGRLPLDPDGLLKMKVTTDVKKIEVESHT